MQDHGYTIVVFTQDNPSKNTTRSLSCIYSPGTFFSNESSCLDAELSNNTTCIWIHYSSKNRSIKEMLTIGIANIDIYTGKTSINEFQTEYYHNPTTYDELEKFVSIYKPNETIIISNLSREIIENIIQRASFVPATQGSNGKQFVQEKHKIRLDYTLSNKECSFIDKPIINKWIFDLINMILNLENNSISYLYFT